MSKVRIYEYAKANNVQSKQLIESLKSMGVEVSNHMSAIDEETLNKAKQAGKPAAAKGQGSTSNQKQNSQNPKSTVKPRAKATPTKQPAKPRTKAAPAKQSAKSISRANETPKPSEQ